MKLSTKRIIIALSIGAGVTAIGVTVWLLGNEPKDTLDKGNPKQTASPTAAASPETTPLPAPSPTLPAEKTEFQKKSSKITSNLNFLEFSSFRNRNSIGYTLVQQNEMGVYEVDISKEGTMGTPKLITKEPVEAGTKGFYNISSGNALDNILSISDFGGKKSIVLHDAALSESKTIYSDPENTLVGRAVFNQLDNRIVYARLNRNASQSMVEIVSNDLDLKDQRIVYQIPAKGDVEDMLTWMDLTEDGSKLLICFRDEGTRNPVLQILDLNTKNTEKLTDSGRFILSARWSKDGSKIVYSELEGDGAANIYLYNLNEKTEIQITTGKGKNLYPDWSYFEDKILYLSEENGVMSLYMTDYQ
ncbi:MAG: DPP IV N-terminal domain-containing protein [Clostridia bacterium]|nr:DPP IV N-terminal domain-containing protein [Clostridia bacterium]